MEGEVILESAPMPGPHGYGSPSYGSPSYGPGGYGEVILDAPGCDAMACSGGGCDGCGGVGCDAALFCDSAGCGGNCGGRCGLNDGCFTICFPQDGWFSAEYLLWYQKGMSLPPLVTRSPVGTNPVLPGAETLFGGNSDYLDDSLDGLRLNMGIWLDRQHRWALQGDYFFFNDNREFFSADGVTGSPSIGRPYSDVSLEGAPNAVRVIARNGVANGTVEAAMESELHSAGFQFRRLLYSKEGCGDTLLCNVPTNYRSRLDAGIGYRYMELEEGLMISDSFTRSGTGAGTGDFASQDLFGTRSQFNGIDMGVYYERQRGCWTLNLRGRFGLGTNQQSVLIDGSTTDPTLGVGGLLAQPSNIGSYERDRISVLPELGATLGYQVTPRLRATVGYTFIYWSNVVRPGDQIDTAINGTLLAEDTRQNVDSLRPAFQFNETDYWIQGISFGGSFCW